MKVEIEELGSSPEFLARTLSDLERFESEHNLLLGVAHNGNPATFYILRESRALVGCACLTEPTRPLLLSKMADHVARALAEAFADRGVSLHGVVGAPNAAQAFLSQWTKRTPIKLRDVISQGIYQLDTLTSLPSVPGTLVVAQPEDFSTARDFAVAFAHECFPNESNYCVRGEAMAKRLVDERGLYFWKNGEGATVSSAAIVRESRNGATLSLVYTPPAYRGHGYASAAVAAVSAIALGRGKKFCNLYTDLSNPTSNSIYQRLGYRRIGESTHFQFGD